MERTRAKPAAALEWSGAALLVIAIKLAWIAHDPVQRVFLGDSASYLHSALVGVPPTDRSMLYPLLLGWLALPAPDLVPMLWWQSAFGALTALIAFGTLRTWLGARFPAALAAAAAIATEPAQILFERMLMAESAGTLCFAAALACGIGYLRTRALRFLLYGVVAGIGAASLRMSLLPVALGMAVLPPLVLLAVAVARRERGVALRALAALLVAGLATKLAHGAYQSWYDLRSDAIDEPGYTAREGAMRLALVAPLVRPAHLERQGLDPRLLAEVGPALRDPATRELQMWAEDGIVAVITRAVGEHRAAERVMRKIATRAVREDPPGFVAMGGSVAAGYFDPATVHHRMQEDLGRRGPNAEELRWFSARFGYEGGDIASRSTPATRWFEAARWWFTGCLIGLVPLAAAVALVRRRDPEPGLYLVLLAAGMTAAQLLFSAIVSYRYLHAFPIVALVALAWLADGIAARRAVRRASG